MDFSDQLERIKSKVEQAGKKDPDLKVFGSNYHKYKFHKPISRAELEKFQSDHGIILPEDYTAFVTTLGNGGPGYFGAAGPFYGIYPLGKFFYMESVTKFISSPAVIHSSMTETEWTDMTAFAENDSDAEHSLEFDLKYDSLFSGLLPIGTQGCNFQTMLALNGPDRGRVVNIDQDLAMPQFAPQKTFMEWYEAWVDRLVGLGEV